MAKLDLTEITAAAEAAKHETFAVDLGNESFTASYDIPATTLERLSGLAEADIPKIVSMAVELLDPADEARFRAFVQDKRFTADNVAKIIEGIVLHSTGKASSKR